jgi:hypothetical protein
MADRLGSEIWGAEMATEYTNGIVFLPPAFDVVEAHMRASGLSCYLEVLDGVWDVLYVAESALDSSPTREVVLALSRAVPLLHFHYSEDFSWRDAVFDGGDEVAGVREDFALWYPFAEALARERGMTRGEFYWHHGDEVRALPEYQAAFQAQFAWRNVGALAAFGTDRRRLAVLEALFSREDPQGGWRRVETFRRMLRLEWLKHKNYQEYYRAHHHHPMHPSLAEEFWSGVADQRILPLPDSSLPVRP